MCRYDAITTLGSWLPSWYSSDWKRAIHCLFLWCNESEKFTVHVRKSHEFWLERSSLLEFLIYIHPNVYLSLVPFQPLWAMDSQHFKQELHALCAVCGQHLGASSDSNAIRGGRSSKAAPRMTDCEEVEQRASYARGGFQYCTRKYEMIFWIYPSFCDHVSMPELHLAATLVSIWKVAFSSKPCKTFWRLTRATLTALSCL